MLPVVALNFLLVWSTFILVGYLFVSNSFRKPPLFLWMAGAFAAGPLLVGLVSSFIYLFAPNIPILGRIIISGIALFGIFYSLSKFNNNEPLYRFEYEYSLVPQLISGGLILCFFMITWWLPTDWHDALIIKQFGIAISEGVAFFDLPRYQPDARGFFYPLTHPPLTLELIGAVSKTGGPRAISLLFAALLVGTFSALFVLGAKLGKSSWYGLLTLLLLMTSPKWLLAMTSNNQDIFRFANLVLVLLCLPLQTRSIVGAAIFGVFLGMGPAIHNLQVPVFAAVLAANLCLLFSNKLSVNKFTITALIATPIAISTYVVNRILTGHWIIKQNYSYDLSIISKYINDAKLLWGDLASLKDPIFWDKIKFMIDPMHAGLLSGIALISILVFAYKLWKKEINASEDDHDVIWLYSLGIFLFVAITDPFNVVLHNLHKSYWHNWRYPQIVFPIFALVGTWAASQSKYLKSIVPIMCVPLTLYIIASNVPNTKLPGACLFCDVEQQLLSTTVREPMHALRWLESHQSDVKPNCLTFREGEYFSWSSLPGSPYYSEASGIAVGATSPENATKALESEGINCLFFRADSMYVSLKNDATALMSVRQLTDTISIGMDGSEIWLIDHYTAATDRVNFDYPNILTHEIELSLPTLELAEVAITFESKIDKPFNIYSKFSDKNYSWHGGYPIRVTDQEISFWVAGHGEDTEISLSFGQSSKIYSIVATKSFVYSK